MKPNCKDCPLRGQPRVSCEFNSYARIAIVGEGPGKYEEEEGRPFVGPSGKLLNRALEGAGITREVETFVTNALECRPPKGKKLRPKEWKKALECCAPRLGYELQQHADCKMALALGAKALYALTGKKDSRGNPVITPWVGAPLESDYGWVYPIFHPAMCLRSPAYIPVFKHWVKGACRLEEKRKADRDWEPDRISEYAIETCWSQDRTDRLQFLSKPREGLPVGVDVETAGVDPLNDDLLCVAVANKNVAAVVEPDKLQAQDMILFRKILADPDIPLVMHNGQHDVLSLEGAGFEINNYRYDTLLMHAVVAPQLRHDLGIVAAIELPYERWKSEFREAGSFQGSTMSQLKMYCGKDSTVTSELVEPLQRQIERTHKGQELLDEYMAMNQVAIRMRRRGVQVDPTRFETHEKTLLASLDETRESIADLVPEVDIGKNGATGSVKKLFFEKLGCKPIKYGEESGEPSLDAFTLESYCKLGNPLIERLSRLILSYRKDAKLLSTYIYGLPMDKDHVVHPTWKVYGTLTGRWASQDPNAQNIPKIMRDLYVAREGTRIVKGDYSQLELRIVALLSGDEKLLEAYALREDVHALNAADLFGVHFTKHKPHSKEWTQLRKIAKIFVYGVNYGGEADNLWGQMVVKFPDLRLPQVRAMHTKWFKNHPKIKEWQMGGLREANDKGYVEEVLSGRREYFHDGMVDKNKVLNYPVQAAAGTIMNKAILQVDKALDWEKESLLFQVHDELVVEGPDQGRLVNILRTNMEVEMELNGHQMTFPIDPEVGDDWRDCEEV